jgi:large subunit ribosomal protein L25
MKSITIHATVRKEISKSELNKIRREGNVPCVLYGGQKEVHFFAPALSFRNLVYTPDTFTVELNVDGTVYNAVMRDIQFHPVTDRINHIDFMEYEDNKPFVINLPVKLKGTSEGVREGGRLVFKMKRVSVIALAKDLPDNIELDITKMKIGDSIKVGDLKQANVTFLDPPQNLVVGVRYTRAVVEEEVTTAAAAVPGTPAVPGAAPAPGVQPAAGAAAPAAAPAKAEPEKKGK